MLPKTTLIILENLKLSFFFQFPHKPIVYQILRFELAYFLVGQSQQANDVVYAVGTWVYAPFEEERQAFI
jgi:hypothetical protein